MWEKKDPKAKSPEPKLEDYRSTERVSSVTHSPSSAFGVHEKGDLVKIGKAIFIKGEITGAQDLVIEGKFEGKIEFKEHQVTIGEHGNISGEIHARHVTIYGEVFGNTYAQEKLEIKSSGTLKGDIVAPRLIIEDGAYFKGTVEMEQKRLQVHEGKSVEKFAALTAEENLDDPISRV